MRKILSLLAAITLTATSATTVVACGASAYNGLGKNDTYKDIVFPSRQVSEKEITGAAMARLRTVILDNEYGLSDAKNKTFSMKQSADALTTLDNSEPISNVYNRYFNEGSLHTATYSDNIKLQGTLGEDGEIFKQIFDKLTDFIPAPLKTIIFQLFNIDVNKIADKSVESARTLISILTTINAQVVGTGIPIGIDKLYSLNKVGKFTPVDVLNNLLNDLVKKLTQEKVNSFFDSLTFGVNFDLSDYKVEDLNSIFMIEVANAAKLFGSEKVDGPLFGYDNDNKVLTSDSTELNKALIASGQFLGTTFLTPPKQSSNNIMMGVMHIFRALSALSIKMQIFNDDNKRIDNTDFNNKDHIFDKDKTNVQFISERLTGKKLSEVASEHSTWVNQEDLKYLNFGELISNLVYFLAPNDEGIQQGRLFKLLNIMFADKVVDNKISSNVSSLLAGVFSSTNKDVVTSDNLSTVAKTLDDTFTNAFLTNTQIPDPGTGNKFASNLKDWLDTNEEFKKNPFTVAYHGDLTNMVTANSLDGVIGAPFKAQVQKVLMSMFTFYETAERPSADKSQINLLNLFNLKLRTIFSASGVKDFSVEDLTKNNALFPNVADFFVNKSIISLAKDLSEIFALSGMETSKVQGVGVDKIPGLKYRYAIIPEFKEVINEILYGTELTADNKSILWTIINNLNDPSKNLSFIGYDDQMNYKVDSPIGRLLIFFVPEFANKEKQTPIDKDINGKDVTPYQVISRDTLKNSAGYTDNFGWILSGIANFLKDIIPGTNYEYWLKPVLGGRRNINGNYGDNSPAFTIIEGNDVRKPKFTYFKGKYRKLDFSQVIKSGDMYIQFDPTGLEILNDNGQPIQLGSGHKAVYHITFERLGVNGAAGTPTDTLKFTKIEKLK
ncbi:MOLPALP family lipoprotein [Mesoplasma lactucae]|uniref:Uncharacterized protein n=1 Tax=Mesoplasma lactucae ATCC 49193 TaxID=81460 RepID=A0A291IQT7_9MOLU|nr:MOLPALP family lipoprotein [Mesoplasma lactucae]ATG97212.1 hypothetical protein CP520_00330 [Mesoplasma lactucae ATCC 49193]ATZ20346.1 hypothetical protein MLACT_v1c05250 [Mesoplasma lactucae ATCC 49193]MCL8216517.1 hypothetical protein [Mesoplasma lactucae ATCC 49193]